VRVRYSSKLKVVQIRKELVRVPRDDNAKEGEGGEEVVGGYF